MNPEEREELARLVPSPGEPVLTSDRHDLLKDHLMRELTKESQGSREIATAPGAPEPAPRLRFAMIAVPVAAVAAVTATVVVGAVGSGTATTDPKAVDLLNRIAAVAASKKAVAVRDDQYVYVRTKGFMKFSDNDIRILRESNWTAVDGKRSGLRRITVLSGPPPRPRDPFSSYAKGTKDMKLSPDPNVTTFRELEALPTDPDALLDKIYADTKDKKSINRGAALEKIGDMLADATLLPEVDAALYRAAAKIPGVWVVEDVKDYAGRPGIGLSFKNGDDRAVWVFDKKSLSYLGTDEEALLDTAVVDKISETPGN
ncbi:CU044_5270 family protein [Streptomyces sp. NPDC054833]